MGFKLESSNFFDTISLNLAGGKATASALVAATEKKQINIRQVDANRVSISFDETGTRNVLQFNSLSLLCLCGKVIICN